MTTNEQAVEACRRAKTTCKYALLDAAKTLTHYCKDDKSVAETLKMLEIRVNNCLDQQARAVFDANIEIKG